MASLKIVEPSLVVTRTPLRISFAGGGTDLPAFYEKDHGAVLSTAINKYIYVTVKRHSEVFNEPIRLNYSKSEQVHKTQDIENDIIRECLKFLEIDPPIYINTVGDLPASTGLGGSSSFAVGLLNALHAFRGERVSAGQLAEEASYIEIDVLKEPIGKQDQYAAAFGGVNCYCFKPGGFVTVEHQRLNNGTLNELFGHLMSFWTGHQRDASSVLTEQKANIEQKRASLCQLRDQVYQMGALLGNGHCNWENFGRLLDEAWRIKRGLASTISNQKIDTWYQLALDAGALGGKICGAGGGGFFLLFVPKEKQNAIRQALKDLKEVPIGPEAHGSQILYTEK